MFCATVIDHYHRDDNEPCRYNDDDNGRLIMINCYLFYQNDSEDLVGLIAYRFSSILYFFYSVFFFVETENDISFFGEINNKNIYSNLKSIFPIQYWRN